MSQDGTLGDAGLPMVSVLSTSYNHGRWLADTLDSVQRQDYPKIEHVVVDDGSNDGSIEILASEAKGGLRWASTPRIGQARALNEAFRMSTGEIIGWLSSDDVYYDGGVVRGAVNMFVRHPEAALVYGHAVLIDENGLQLHAEWVPPVSVFGWHPPMHILQPAAFVRRSALGHTLVDESFDIAMDTELWLRLQTAHGVIRLNRILAAERHHPARKSYTMGIVSAAELNRLDDAYRPAGGRPSHRRSRGWGIAYRLAGLSLIPHMQRVPAGFHGDLDSWIALVRRQIAVPRSRMAWHDGESSTD